MAHDVQHRLLHFRIVIVQIRLLGIEAVPVILACDLIPGPVGLLCIGEDDAGLEILLIRIRPDKIIPVFGITALAGFLEPGVLDGAVIHDQIHDDLHAMCMDRIDELMILFQCSEARVHIHKIADVVTVVKHRRRIDRLDPDAVDPEGSQVIQLLRNADEITVSVPVAIHKGAGIDLIKIGTHIPGGLVHFKPHRQIS